MDTHYTTLKKIIPKYNSIHRLLLNESSKHNVKLLAHNPTQLTNRLSIHSIINKYVYCYISPSSLFDEKIIWKKDTYESFSKRTHLSKKNIKEEEQNENLYEYLETALLWLDTHDEVANFHLIMLLEITKFLGFYPESTTNDNSFFEMSDGVFIPYETISCLSEKETLLLRKLMVLKPDNATKVFHVSERQSLLKILMDYYALHLDGFAYPKSIEVLREVFN